METAAPPQLVGGAIVDSVLKCPKKIKMNLASFEVLKEWILP